MTNAKTIKEQLPLFKGVVDHLITMVEKVRSSFNRQNVAGLEEIANYEHIVLEEIALLSKDLDKMLCEVKDSGQVSCLQLESVLTHLQLMAKYIAEMGPIVRQQITNGIPFSMKGNAQANQVFDGQLEMLRGLADIFQTDNEILKKVLYEEKGPILCQKCIDFATDHEARMIEGLCQPHAAPIFLNLLDAIRDMARHSMEVAHLLMHNQRR